MADSQAARIAVLEEKVDTLEDALKGQAKDIKEQGRDIRQINESVMSMVAGFKIGKWIFGSAIALGPAIGVIVSKLYGG